MLVLIIINQAEGHSTSYIPQSHHRICAYSFFLKGSCSQCIPNQSFNTAATQHLFRVQASEANSTLVITVTDRFGNVSTQTMTRPKAFTVGWD